MQQNYNRIYAAAEKNNGILDPDDQISIELEFEDAVSEKGKVRKICKEHFMRIANTKIGFKTFTS